MLQVIDKKAEILSGDFKKQIIKDIKKILNNINENTESLVYKKNCITTEGKEIHICLYYECHGQNVNKTMLDAKGFIKRLKRINFNKEITILNEFIEFHLEEKNKKVL
ncbi:Uncharacterised protein [uncultured Clostridium sp.]|nr:hypothetical protein [[Eubacterium] tenue]SCJ53489.1 Uncharacterised protein [uncultured Clostridium sp.]SCJ53612.1 Uncharacterised protein [uncultured Clostridium sp.]